MGLPGEWGTESKEERTLRFLLIYRAANRGLYFKLRAMLQTSVFCHFGWYMDNQPSLSMPVDGSYINKNMKYIFAQMVSGYGRSGKVEPKGMKLENITLSTQMNLQQDDLHWRPLEGRQYLEVRYLGYLVSGIPHQP